MRIAALVIGIIAGLTGLSTATYGHAIFGLFSNNAKLLYLLPIATFVGAGLALSKPAPSAALMLGSGAIWFLIGANVGFGVNIFTIGAALLSGVAGALSAFAASQVYLNDFNSAVGPNSQRIATRTRQSATEYDRAKWDALVKYDPQIRDVVKKIRSELGSKWEDEFASSYLALNDKQYLPEMIRKIMADAKADDEEEKRLARIIHPIDSPVAQTCVLA